MFGEKKEDSLHLVSQGPAPTQRTRNETTIIESDACFEGKLTFEGDVSINGTLKGEVFSSGELTVGISGRIEGSIDIGTIHVRGEVHGTISAKNKIVIHTNAAVYGDVSTPSLVIEDGALFEGGCVMDKKQAKKETPLSSNLKTIQETKKTPDKKPEDEKNTFHA